MSRSRIVLAPWVLPVTRPPLREGAVRVTENRILEVGPREDLLARHPEDEHIDLGNVILLPSLVNAHTHLSLTTLAGRIDAGGDPYTWLRGAATEARALAPEAVREATRRGVEESRRLGTGLLGEVTSRTEGAIDLAGAGDMYARVFFEFLGVQEERARTSFAAACDQVSALHDPNRRARVRPGLSPHAPYSVWPSLWANAVSLTAEAGLVWSSHVAELPGEAEFLIEGTGPVRTFLRSLGVWDDTFPVSGRTAVHALDDLGALDARALLVHGVHLDPADIERLARSAASLCLCPRSNAALGLPPPPVTALYRAGVNLCLGTDSKASNEDLGIWGEMRAVRALAPEIPPGEILGMATIRGARALGFEDELGSLEPGRVASLITVEAGDLGEGDPRERLVGERVESGVRRLTI